MSEYVVMLFYDLPMVTKSEVKSYTSFRKLIKSKGFYQVQESFYCANSRDKESSKQLIKFIKEHSPLIGNIRALIITSNIFNSMEILAGEITIQEKIISNKSVILEF